MGHIILQKLFLKFIIQANTDTMCDKYCLFSGTKALISSGWTTVMPLEYSQVQSPVCSYIYTLRVPVSVRHVAIGESNQELAKRNLNIFANLAKSNK